ncbi:hypothetical protein QTO01_10020 [Vibrio mytili]
MHGLQGKSRISPLILKLKTHIGVSVDMLESSTDVFANGLSVVDWAIATKCSAHAAKSSMG